MLIENVIGKPVTDNNFFGRHRELEELTEITPREHVLMLAPRRVGKTSLLHALGQAIDREGLGFSAYASVGSATNEVEFVQVVLNEIYRTKHGRKLKPSFFDGMFRRGRAVKKVTVAGTGVELDHAQKKWQEEADKAFERVFATDRPLTLMIDELPIMVLALAAVDTSGNRVRAFLQWFRHIRQHPAASKLRFVLAGSVGLDNVTRRHQLSETINDLRVWRLGPFDSETAHEFLGELASSYDIELPVDVREALCGVAEWLIPYHLQVLFSALRGHAKQKKPTVSMIDEVLERVLQDRNYFSHWEERLVGALGRPADEIARVILLSCARDPQGVTFAVLLQHIGSLLSIENREREARWILEVLINDGYLIEHDGRYRFRSGLLRRYWARQAR